VRNNSYFFQFSRSWTTELHAKKDKQLTHAAGLVFCHHNAPIHRITHLARELVGLAKEVGRENNYVAYQVLESFDYTGDELADFRQQRCPKGTEQSDFIIHGNRMNKVLYNIHAVKRALPKGLTYKIVQTLLDERNKSQALIEALIEEAEGIVKAAGYQPALEALKTCLGTDATFWIHLIELWDYLEFEDTIEYQEH
jgi:hypothetical protein